MSCSRPAPAGSPRASLPPSKHRLSALTTHRLRRESTKKSATSSPSFRAKSRHWRMRLKSTHVMRLCSFIHNMSPEST